MSSDFDRPFSEEVLNEALSYELTTEVLEGIPEGLSEKLLTDLYIRANEGDARVVPELMKLIKMYPDFAPLKNYLSMTYQMRGKFSKADKIEKETYRLHPEYLFARLGQAKRHLKAENWEKMKEVLGVTLRLSTFRPRNEKVHISHWQSYYLIVGIYYAKTGNLEAANGILKAFEHVGSCAQEIDQLTYHLKKARSEDFQKRMAEDDRREIRVEEVPMPKPLEEEVHSEFHFSEIDKLYVYELGFPQEFMDELLALDREKLISDLENVIRDAISNSPLYLKRRDDLDYAMIHATMLLSEMKATESLETVLEVLSQHSRILEAWYGDYISWQAIIGVVGADLARLSDWMKTPGISHFGKNFALEAVTHRCLADPARREETVK